MVQLALNEVGWTWRKYIPRQNLLLSWNGKVLMPPSRLVGYNAVYIGITSQCFGKGWCFHLVGYATKNSEGKGRKLPQHRSRNTQLHDATSQRPKFPNVLHLYWSQFILYSNVLSWYAQCMSAGAWSYVTKIKKFPINELSTNIWINTIWVWITMDTVLSQFIHWSPYIFCSILFYGLALNWWRVKW